MTSLTYTPSYLIKNPYSFYFRIKVPKDLQSTLSKKELRYSLKTGNLSKAKNKARLLAGKVHLFYRDIRKGFLIDMNLSDLQIQDMIKKFLQGLIQEYDQPVISNQYIDERDYHHSLTDAEAVKGSLTVLDWKKAEYNAKVHSGDYSEVEPDADRLLGKEGISDADIDKASPAYGKLCSGLLRAEIKGFEYQQQKLSGAYSDDLEKVLECSLPGSPALPQDPKQEPVKPSKTISQVMDDYFQENEKANRWKSKKSRDKARASMNVLIA